MTSEEEKSKEIDEKLKAIDEKLEELEKMKRVSMRQAIGVFRFFHPRRVLRQFWINLKIFLLGGYGYGRIIIIDKNYREREYIIRLKDKIKIGKSECILDPNNAVTGRGGLTTYYIAQGSMLPINMRGTAKAGVAGDFLNFLLERAHLEGQVSTGKDFERMKLMLMILLGICGAMLYFVYQLVEVGI